MNQTNPRRALVLVAASCLACAATALAPLSAIENLKIGDPVPEFSLPRADGPGGELGSRDLLGKPAVVVFWRPGQRLSLEALRDLKTIASELGGAKVNIVAVDTLRSTTSQIQKAMASESLSFPLVADPARVLYGKVGVIVAPTTLVLDAEKTLRFVLASHPRTYHKVILARLKFLLGQIDEGTMRREVEPTVVKLDHDLATAWRMYNLGQRLRSEGKMRQALSVLEKAVSRYPSLTEARCTLGFMKFAEGDLATAARHFQSALTHSPTAPLARLGKAVVLARTGQAESAEPILLSLLGQRSVAARVRYELGRIYQARGQTDRAVTFYHDALVAVFPEPPGTAIVASSGAAAATRRGGPSAPPASRSPAPAVSPPTTVAASLPPAPATTASPPGTAPPAAGGLAGVQPVTPPAGAKYLGVKRCKKCHFQQWQGWKATRMASAWDLLEPGARPEAKEARGLDPTRDYTRDAACLSCHTTGYGHPGGYPKTPPVDARTGSGGGELAGVVCEACHGPGSSYAAIHKDVQDKKRKYSQKELYAAGQYAVDPRVCAVCHGPPAPCVAPGKSFDFATRKEQGTHKHYALQFRSTEP